LIGSTSGLPLAMEAKTRRKARYRRRLLRPAKMRITRIMRSMAMPSALLPAARGLHSSTFQLNLSRV